MKSGQWSSAGMRRTRQRENRDEMETKDVVLRHSTIYNSPDKEGPAKGLLVSCRNIKCNPL